jgi:hypothetical protein
MMMGDCSKSLVFALFISLVYTATLAATVGKCISNPMEEATQNIETMQTTCPIPDLL